MKLRYALVFFVTALVTFLLLRDRWPRPAEPTPMAVVAAPTLTAPAPAAMPPASKPKAKAPKVAVVPSGPPEEAYQKFVPYRVVDNFAIAYGDVILGSVDEDTPPEGFHEPSPIHLWTEREIPYGIATSLPNPGRVEDAVRYLTKATNLVFVPLVDQPDGIVFEPGSEHCLSALGKVGGRQPIRLDGNCGRTEILHEILHALGFLHEHSRGDRDQFVEVLWDNIDPKYKDQFRILPATIEDPARGTPFDLRSIMLYPSNLFGKQEGLVTLRARNGQLLAPVRDGLSPADIRRLRDIYP